MVAKRQEVERGRAKASRPVPEPGKDALVALIRTADRLRNRFAALLEPYGLTNQQFNVLRILRGALPDALPTMEIAERMIEQAPAITGLLDRLEAKQLVERARQSDDRRCVRCAITAQGLALLAELDEPVAQADAEALKRLNEGEVERLKRLLALVGGK